MLDNPSHAVHVAFHSFSTLPVEQHGAPPEHMFFLLLEGEFAIAIGEPVRVFPGMLLLLPSGIPHRLLGGRNVRLWQVSFCPACLGLEESQGIMSSFRKVRLGALPVFELNQSRLAFFIRLLEEFRETGAGNNTNAMLIQRSLLILLLNEINQCASLCTSNDHGPLIAKVLSFIDEQCLQPISLKEVAASVHRSPAYVAAQVKANTGFTVGQWINSRRLTQACARLQHSDVPVEKLAEQVGWQDTTHFIRQFKKAYGQTPAAWRRAQRQY
ncbi:AraC family transcriptional regulator [Aliiglaciecola sp. CAU 1673]|uniref:helix-turn-helix domain-containing protein n=1 Tax=Aliiglaciecola sp. CAU 1673 TaxID=3032595 RepID=UPI0023DCB61D|nr:AraC family transcriptional regulator [Aliiglaciecola sp. CAU 1673]MDF2178390.1 AraC family transcriptional regulator [Aliiglaciecola sp. CAU 1673]